MPGELRGLPALCRKELEPGAAGDLKEEGEPTRHGEDRAEDRTERDAPRRRRSLHEGRGIGRVEGAHVDRGEDVEEGRVRYLAARAQVLEVATGCADERDGQRVGERSQEGVELGADGRGARDRLELVEEKHEPATGGRDFLADPAQRIPVLGSLDRHARLPAQLTDEERQEPSGRQRARLLEIHEAEQARAGVSRASMRAGAERR